MQSIERPHGVLGPAVAAAIDEFSRSGADIMAMNRWPESALGDLLYA